MLTDNSVLLRRQKVLPTLMCAQKKGTKIIPTEDEIVKSNIASFGNEVGAITNRITSMYEVASHFDRGGNEYEVLNYRIRCGQLYQQDCIDKAKGIVSTPMPGSWYERRCINRDADEDTQRLYSAIVADRKPYFMRYIYPALAKQYTNYIKAANKNAMREFDVGIDEMLAVPAAELTDRQLDFIQKYKRYMPVGTGDCLMNQICRKIEKEFDRYLYRMKQECEFDYAILKSGSDYSATHFSAVKKLMAEYDRKVREYSASAGCERISDDERRSSMQLLDDSFRAECSKVCPDAEELCDIVVDLCYSREKTKQFAWRMCGDQINKNLIQKCGKMSFPSKDEEGDIIWKSEHYSIKTVQLGVVE